MIHKIIIAYISIFILILQYLLIYVHLSLILKIIFVIIGLYIADFLTGMIHIFLDNYNRNNKYIKPIAKNFQEHHQTPEHILKKSILELLLETSLYGIPIFFNLINLIFYKTLKYKNILKLCILMQITYVISSHLSQITHMLAHKIIHITKKDKNTIPFKVLNILQSYHIILNPKIHKIHHEKIDRNFPILNGWSNSLINSLLNNDSNL
jgi:hypothetical protein